MEKNEKIKDIFLKAYEKFGDGIFRFCYFKTRNRELALDLSQETFTKTWEYLSSGKEVENLKSFLYRVATNLIIDNSRKKKAVSLDQITETGVDFQDEKVENAAEEIDKKIEIENILKTLDELDESYREILVMRYVEEMTINEIAEVTGKTKNNVSVLIHRGVEKLKEKVKNENE